MLQSPLFTYLVLSFESSAMFAMMTFKNLKWPLSWNWTKPNNRSKTTSFHVMVCQIMMIHILVLGMLCDASSFLFKQLIETSSGRVVGFTYIRLPMGGTATVWNQVPYAMPPTEERRFLPPEPMDAWDYVLPTTKKPKKCIQPFDPDSPPESKPNNKRKHDENCLFINIHAPEPRDNRTAVLVYIDGGDSKTRSLIDYDCATLASQANVIVVSIQHRGTALGFLSLEDDEILGNAGLYDQKMALEWVKKNIRYFGGDDKRITIMGQSAGAAYVGHHLLSPLSRNLFSQAIMLSGSPLSNWATMSKGEGLRRSRILAEEMGCRHPTPTLTLKCLQKASLVDLMRTEYKTFQAKGLAMPFVPMVDGTFITQPPLKALMAWNFKKAKILTGVNMEESSDFLYNLLPEEFRKLGNVAVNGTQFEESVRTLFRGINDMDLKAFKKLYKVGSDEYALVKMLSEHKITLPTLKFSKVYAGNGNDVNGNDVFSFIFNQGPAKKNDPFEYVFGRPLQRYYDFKYNPEEKALSKRVMTLLGNFVKTGDPSYSDETDQKTLDWPKYLSSDWNMVLLKARLEKETDQIIKKFKANESATWDEFRETYENMYDNKSDN